MNKQSIKMGLVATSILLPMSVTVANADTIQQANIEYKIITGNSVNFRKGPSTSYDSIGKFYKGDKVEYIGKSGEWINVKYNGKVGYVHGNYVSNSSEGNTSDNTIKYNKIVSASSLNVRKGPGTSYSKIDSIPNGTKVGVISESNGWAKISYNGQIGYVSSQYLKSSEDSTSPSEEKVKYNKKVNASSLNIRKGPSTSHSKIGSIPYGAEVGVISESNGWAKIKYNGQIGYVSSKYLTADMSNGGGTTSQSADKVINLAQTLLGKPYVWGAEGPSSFDCSGFTQYVFKKSAGINIPRVSKDQSKFGQYVNKNNLQKGDLIFFDTSGSNDGNVSHVGIYMGNNKMIHASSSKGKVVISELSNYYNNAYVNARRVL
ncbi:C40 family peptidase [Romboutsia sp. 1001713B170131_170501_G6]|uniref:C40 family peptidase n=1 Tax=Romboutsia sp. 1001713B170131_170501_G6 TaxID=2787108 RepID=UPI0018AB223F|nr:SH3 domain-containing protein [Romboutsia sp. 1001713B170131_170501_G6]